MPRRLIVFRPMPATVVVLAFLTAAGCGGRPASVLLPPVSALTYQAPAGWVATANPRELPPEPGLQFVSAYRPAAPTDAEARLALYTLAVPGGLTYPATEAAQVGVVSGLIDAPSFVRWIVVEPMPVAEVPGLHAVADTAKGTTHQYVALGRRKLFLLELSLPAAGSGKAAALQAALLAGTQLK